MLWEFLKNFYGEPQKYFTDYTPEYWIRAECTHFLCSAYVGLLVHLLLMWIISSRNPYKCLDRSIFLFSLSVAVFVSILVHICIDAFTNLA